MSPDQLAELEAAATPGPWAGTTEGSYDQRHAAAKAYDAVRARRDPDSPDIQFSDLSWVRTSGDDWLNVALVGNGVNGPENAHFVAALRNAAPALIAVARAAQAWRDKPYATNADPEWLAVVDALAALDAA